MKIFAITLFSFVVLWLLWRINSRPRAMTEQELIEFLEAWIHGTLSSGEWDYFESCKLSDPKLEAVRVRCMDIYLNPAYTLPPQLSWALNEHGKAAVRQLILELVGHNTAAA